MTRRPMTKTGGIPKVIKVTRTTILANFDPDILAQTIIFFKRQYPGSPITPDNDVRGSRSNDSWIKMMRLFQKEQWLGGILIAKEDWLTCKSCRQISILVSYYQEHAGVLR